MVFFLNLLYSIWGIDKLSYVYAHLNIKKNFLSYFIILFPVWVVWLIICGGQYGVGTDYFTYYSLFREVDVEFYFVKNEWLFASIVELVRGLGLPAQSLFFVFYFINVFFFCKILYYLENRTTFIYVLLYISLSTVFNNQLNGLRQYCAVHVISYAIISFCYNKSYIRYLLLVAVAGGFHLSAFLMFPFVFVIEYLRDKIVSRWLCVVFVIIGAIFSVNDSFEWLTDLMSTYLPSTYSSYIGGELDSGMNQLNVITKLAFVPVYLLSITVYSHSKLNKLDSFLYLVGIVGYAIRLFFLGNIIFNRVSYYFLLISILPIYVYLKYLYNNKRKLESYMIIFIFILLYLLKTILFAGGEYLYQSIYNL